MKDILSLIVSDPRLELEWLDLLSQLEYVGCRKIMKSVSFDAMTGDALRHASEEASHAYLLKALVEKKGLKRSWREGRFSQIGWDYFQTLDQEVSVICVDQPYPAVSWAIERRVLMVYPAYLKSTNDAEVKRVLAQILAQERGHARQFDEFEFPESVREKIISVEEKLWVEFVSKCTQRSQSNQCSAAHT